MRPVAFAEGKTDVAESNILIVVKYPGQRD